MAKFIVTLVVETPKNDKPPTKKAVKLFITQNEGGPIYYDNISLLKTGPVSIRVRSVDLD